MNESSEEDNDEQDTSSTKSQSYGLFCIDTGVSSVDDSTNSFAFLCTSNSVDNDNHEAQLTTSNTVSDRKYDTIMSEVMREHEMTIADLIEEASMSEQSQQAVQVQSLTQQEEKRTSTRNHREKMSKVVNGGKYENVCSNHRNGIPPKNRIMAGNSNTKDRHVQPELPNGQGDVVAVQL